MIKKTILEEIKIVDGIKGPSQLVRASIFQRIGNLILDIVFLNVFAFVFGMAIVLTDVQYIFEGINSFWFTVLLYFIYCVNFEAFWGGRTVGKLITGTKVVNKNGTKITFWKAIARSLCRLIPFDPISFLTWDGKLDGWHDKFTRTTVVCTRCKKHLK